MNTATKFSIPEMDDGELAKLAVKIKPLIKGSDGLQRHIEPVHLRNIAYTWSPKLVGDPVPNLQKIHEFRCLHKWGYYGYFKPSVGEVLRQIPAELIERTGFFEIVKSPDTAEDLNDDLEALNAGFHVSTVYLYAKQ